MNKILRDWKFQETKLDKVWRQKNRRKTRKFKKKIFLLKNIWKRRERNFTKLEEKFIYKENLKRDFEKSNFLIKNNEFWKFSFSKKWKFIDQSESPTNSPTKNFQKSTEQPLAGERQKYGEMESVNTDFIWFKLGFQYIPSKFRSVTLNRRTEKCDSKGA